MPPLAQRLPGSFDDVSGCGYFVILHLSSYVTQPPMRLLQILQLDVIICSSIRSILDRKRLLRYGMYDSSHSKIPLDTMIMIIIPSLKGCGLVICNHLSNDGHAVHYISLTTAHSSTSVVPNILGVVLVFLSCFRVGWQCEWGECEWGDTAMWFVSFVLRYVARGFVCSDVSNFRNLSLLFGVLKFLLELGLWLKQNKSRKFTL
jgi:hypothetical protein